MEYINRRPLQFRRLGYYLSSLINLYKNLDPSCYTVFTRALISKHFPLLKLKRYGLSFEIKNLLDALALKEVVLDEEYESCGVEIDKNDRIIVDIGAGFGDFSILMAQKYPRTKIYAFEPDRSYFALFENNLKINRIANVKPVNKAVTSLKEVFKLIGQSRIDLLKMDCEGCEFRILNPKNKANIKKVNKYVMEYHEEGENKIMHLKNTLESCHFKLNIMPRKQVANIGLLSAQSS